jgi:hypothetical protein
MAIGDIHRTDHATPIYPQKLALTLLTSGGCLVGIVRSRTKATELVNMNNSKGMYSDCQQEHWKTVHSIYLVLQLFPFFLYDGYL